ncbi:unnamed protein product, partial [Staurois parvus]
MYSPKKKKKTSLPIHTKLSMCRVTLYDMSYQGIRGGHWKKGRIREDRFKQHFYTMQKINRLGSTVSITSMLYCQGWTDNSWGPWAIEDHGAPVSLPKLKKSL